MKDYYYILGIGRTATIEQIKSAYLKLAIKFHPDKNDGDKFFEDRFKDVQEAYEKLSNPESKQDYDINLNNDRRQYNNEEEIRKDFEEKLKNKQREFEIQLKNKEKEYKEQLKRIEQKINKKVQRPPEIYRSILDESQKRQDTECRYSDEDLDEFRNSITSRLEAARKELNYLQGHISRIDDTEIEDTQNRPMNMEDGSGAMEREQLAQLASRQIQFIGHLENALMRIEKKTYGICRVTGKLIEKARLLAVPNATLSIEAKKILATKQN